MYSVHTSSGGEKCLWSVDFFIYIFFPVTLPGDNIIMVLVVVLGLSGSCASLCSSPYALYT